MYIPMDCRPGLWRDNFDTKLLEKAFNISCTCRNLWWIKVQKGEFIRGRSPRGVHPEAEPWDFGEGIFSQMQWNTTIVKSCFWFFGKYLPKVLQFFKMIWKCFRILCQNLAKILKIKKSAFMRLGGRNPRDQWMLKNASKNQWKKTIFR